MSSSLIEAAELKNVEEKWGVSAAAAAPVTIAGAGGADAAPAASKTEFDIHLTAVELKKLTLLKKWNDHRTWQKLRT